MRDPKELVDNIESSAGLLMGSILFPLGVFLTPISITLVDSSTASSCMVNLVAPIIFVGFLAIFCIHGAIILSRSVQAKYTTPSLNPPLMIKVLACAAWIFVLLAHMLNIILIVMACKVKIEKHECLPKWISMTVIIICISVILGYCYVIYDWIVSVTPVAPPTAAPAASPTAAPAAPATVAPAASATVAPAASPTVAPAAPPTAGTVAPAAPAIVADAAPSTVAPDSPRTAATIAPTTHAPAAPATVAPPSTVAPAAPASVAPAAPPTDATVAPAAPAIVAHVAPATTCSTTYITNPPAASPTASSIARLAAADH